MNLNEYINMVLYTRSLENNIKTLNTDEMINLRRKCANVRLVDVRSPQEYAEGHKAGAILLPNYEMEQNAERILKNKNDIIILYCASGIRSRMSAEILQKKGYMRVYVLEQ